jgi:hypothetical protein
MTDSTIDITQPFDRPQKLLKIIDNGDETYAVATSERKSFDLEVAEGHITGYSLVHKFGASAVVGTSLAPIALANTYNTPTAAANLEFLSSDANDTAAGSGARQVTVVGLGADWTEVSQTVTTNGTTAVALTTPLLRLYRWYVSSSGTYGTSANASHAGTLTIRAAGGGATWSTITVSPFPMGQSQIGAYTVPLGKTAYLLTADMFVSSTKAVDLLLFQRPNANDVATPYSGAIRLISQWAGVTGTVQYKPRYPRGAFVGPCDIGFMGKVASGTGSCTVEFELVMETT